APPVGGPECPRCRDRVARYRGVHRCLLLDDRTGLRCPGAVTHGAGRRAVPVPRPPLGRWHPAAAGSLRTGVPLSRVRPSTQPRNSEVNPTQPPTRGEDPECTGPVAADAPPWRAGPQTAVSPPSTRISTPVT